ncbi:hypothetical protein COU37_02235 [Candidatus Micrarchaeota archaeon CG10_big_fil_rev_8_21_14_0_10_45_29]|nr:MAG: hypothetical protein COU37_02235 [Candidatus Micrarchaeota archaeon CG10_big_fil_rev_8_21_14_0_10_45_29]
MNFSSIKPILEETPIYTNSNEVANISGVSLTMWDVSIAALISRLNLFYVGEAGPGKTQLSTDLANLIFNAEALDLRGSLDLDLKSLFTRMDLGKLNKMEGSTDQLYELTEKVNFHLSLIDELNRCPPVIQNQFFNITDGYIEFQGKKAYFGKGEGEHYSVGIATGNLGDGVYTGTFSIDNALRDRLHLTLDFDFYYPLPEDTLSVSMGTTDPRVRQASKKDSFEPILHSYSELKSIKSEDYLDAWLAGQFLDHGLDFVDVASGMPQSKRILKNVYPDILVSEGSQDAGVALSYVRPFTLRGVSKTLALAKGLCAVASAKSGSEFSLDYNSVFEAYRLILPYSGALTPKLLDDYRQNPNLAANAIAKEASDAFLSGTEEQEGGKTVRKGGAQAFSHALSKATEGQLSNKDIKDLTGNWKFAVGILQRQNTLATTGQQKQKLEMKV